MSISNRLTDNPAWDV